MLGAYRNQRHPVPLRESEWAIRPVDVVDAGTDHTSSARRETCRADSGRVVAAPQLWLDYRGRPWSPNAVGKAFTVLVRRFVRSAVGVELNVPVITLHGTRHSFNSPPPGGG